MNLTPLKSYAPQARRDFMAAVSERAALLGITATSIADATTQGDITLIAGKPWPKAVGAQREELVKAIRAAGAGETGETKVLAKGFSLVMEQVAYSWFNRFVALRFMELHGYLDHGFMVLGAPDDASGEAQPQILAEILHVIEVGGLPGLAKEEVLTLKQANKDEELYRKVLVAQCNALNAGMPFLFERVGDATELLLPDHLLRPKSILRQLLAQIPAGDWQQVEILGWLYQFYISEKKEAVIGNTVKTEDIPAATQLFTPNWIVQYLVQNSLGKQWLEAHPASALKAQMPYYIEPAAQDAEVVDQLAALTPASLKPEQLMVLDPACGSGHILVEAYDLLKQIYLEMGHPKRDIPRQILTHNLFGLEIDERAAQLSRFALLMKARADDRTILAHAPQPQVVCLQNSGDLEAASVFDALAHGVNGGPGFTQADVQQVLALFSGEKAKTFGSLIRVPERLAGSLKRMWDRAKTVAEAGDIHRSPVAEKFAPIAQQGWVLASRFDAVVANPPYMGSKGMNMALKTYAKDAYPDSKSDLFAMFIERGFELAKVGTGHNAMVTMQSWMFLSSYEEMRQGLLRDRTITSMAHLAARAFGSISGEVVSVTAFSCRNIACAGHVGTYFRLVEGDEADKQRKLLGKANRYTARQADFRKIPGWPVAYWVSDAFKNIFNTKDTVGSRTISDGQTKSGDNDKFLRAIWEVDATTVGQNSKWWIHPKGGSFRKWYGNIEWVINWSPLARAHYRQDRVARILPEYLWHEPGISWTLITSGEQSFRLHQPGHIFNLAAPTLFIKEQAGQYELLAFLNSPVAFIALKFINPTLNMNVGEVQSLPFNACATATGKTKCKELTSSAKLDWDSLESSWDFQKSPLLTHPAPNLQSAYAAHRAAGDAQVAEMKRLEEENNQLFISAYGLQDELTPEVPIKQITLFANPAYRYPDRRSRGQEEATPRTSEELEALFREDTAKEFISYALGCMMGRYSLDKPGLIYAHSEGKDFDPSQYQTFPADEDGIIPVTDRDWFADDACNRLIKFIETVWGAASLEDNLQWLVTSLGVAGSGSAREALRSYLADTKQGFYGHHLSFYKKRPIYWMVTSGKEGAFQALIYLHRYHAGTLARLRSEYVTPLIGKIGSAIAREEAKPGLTTKEAKALAVLKKQLAELNAFDAELHHLASQRIALDLDDGVKVNYAKLSPLLAREKDVTGGSEE